MGSRGDVRTETIPLTDADVAYLVGRGGQTRQRLERFSGAHLSIDKDVAEISGPQQARAASAAAFLLRAMAPCGRGVGRVYPGR